MHNPGFNFYCFWIATVQTGYASLQNCMICLRANLIFSATKPYILFLWLLIDLLVSYLPFFSFWTMVLCIILFQRKGWGWNRDFLCIHMPVFVYKQTTLLTKTLKKYLKKIGHNTHKTISLTVANIVSLPKISFHVLHIKEQADEPGT